MRSPRRGRRTAAALLSLALALPLSAQALATPAPDSRSGTDTDAPPTATALADTPHPHEVAGVATRADRTVLASSGVAIDAVHQDTVTATLTADQAAELRDLGYTVTPVQTPRPTSSPAEYTDHDTVRATVDQLAEDHPDLLDTEVIGSSYEGRDIIAVRLGTAAEADGVPEVLLTHNMHAREHLTAEMALSTLALLTDGYGSDPRITELLDTRTVWVVPIVNPDGKVHDMESGQFRMWRKNREPHGGATGTDLNRNFAHQWGCCGGSSGSPTAETYRGPSAASAPETRVVKNFVRGRVIDGEQRITAHIDFHTYGELVLWPYGYTHDSTAPGLDEDARDTFTALGTELADTNGYTPQQISDLYVADGGVNDWMWADQEIFSFTFEMYPGSPAGGGFYPPGDVIERETSRNHQAVLTLLDHAQCPYGAIGKEAQYCAAP